MLYEAHMVLMTLAEGRSYVGFDVSSCHCGEGHPCPYASVEHVILYVLLGVLYLPVCIVWM